MESLTSVGVGVTTEATISFLAKIKKHIGYIFQYKENLKILEQAEEKLEAKSKDANSFARDRNRNQREVSSTVKLWEPEANELYQKSRKEISRHEISRLNLWSRYSTSKHASEMAEEIIKKVKDAPDFGTSFDRPASNLGAKFDLSGFREFDSRTSIVNKVLEALKDEKVRMCSICGMGGTGKTTLAKKLVQRVEGDHLFDKVAMATVSQNPNPQEIKGEIMSSLGWKSESRNLFDCLMNSNEKILLILDDVWKEQDFEEIGIPKGNLNLKILLTSRKKDMCQRMGSDPNFDIKVLANEEAWDLFKARAIKSIEKLKLHSTARKIADGCGGLPIVIVTLSTALNFEEKPGWNDTLHKLQKSNLLGIIGMEKVYSGIQLSYEFLDKEAQSCFRIICCLFPKEYDVLVEDVVCCVKGLRLFGDVETMEEARDRVETIIHRLKKSFFLVDGRKAGNVNMHDVFREFAISFSSTDKNPYIMGSQKVMEKWPESDQYENCSAISLVCSKIEQHPVDLKCPKLEILNFCMYEISTQLPIGFFDGMKELKVANLKVSSVAILQPLTVLKKLRSLRVQETRASPKHNGKFGDVLGHGGLENLEILEFVTSWSCDFPEEIGFLWNLRVLKFSKVEMKYIAPGVLSKLVKLEELEMPLMFFSWGYRETGGERVNASLKELESLPLTTLKISAPKGSIFAEKLVKNLQKFHIAMGSYYNNRITLLPKNDGIILHDKNTGLQVSDVDASDITENGISGLLWKCEFLSLTGVRDLEYLIFPQENGFPKWKDIEIRNEREYLVDSMAERVPATVISRLEVLNLVDMDDLKEIIWHFSKIDAPLFSNLYEIEIKGCYNLKHVFPISVARELSHVQSIKLFRCFRMKKVLYMDEVGNGNQVSSSVELSTPTVETSTSAGTILNPSTSVADNIDDKAQSSCIPCLPAREKPPKMISSPQIMEENIEKEADNVTKDTIKIFPQLKWLNCGYLRNLIVFYDGNQAIEFPSLETFGFGTCDKMEALSYVSVDAPRLQEIEIGNIMYPTAREDLSAIVKKALEARRDIAKKKEEEELAKKKEEEELAKKNENDKNDEIHQITTI